MLDVDVVERVDHWHCGVVDVGVVEAHYFGVVPGLDAPVVFPLVRVEVRRCRRSGRISLKCGNMVRQCVRILLEVAKVKEFVLAKVVCGGGVGFVAVAVGVGGQGISCECEVDEIASRDLKAPRPCTHGHHGWIWVM